MSKYDVVQVTSQNWLGKTKTRYQLTLGDRVLGNFRETWEAFEFARSHNDLSKMVTSSEDKEVGRSHQLAMAKMGFGSEGWTHKDAIYRSSNSKYPYISWV
jgi:hypothetical protein